MPAMQAVSRQPGRHLIRLSDLVHGEIEIEGVVAGVKLLLG